jgi:plastocyanin domain-containing protein
MAHNKSVIQFAMIVAVLLVAGFFLISGGSAREGGIVSVGASSGEVQVVKMHVEGAQYIFEPATVKKGATVRLEADMTRMPGCSRGVMSSELGIRKTFTSQDNTLEFTPSKAGTFYIACSMNMYKGTLTVLESDGSASAYVQKPLAAAASCGASGGGCGCGG